MAKDGRATQESRGMMLREEVNISLQGKEKLPGYSPLPLPENH